MKDRIGNIGRVLTVLRRPKKNSGERQSKRGSGMVVRDVTELSALHAVPDAHY
jgi:hypothetical protein